MPDMGRVLQVLALGAGCAILALGQTPAADQAANQAYAALRGRQYDEAISFFQRAIAADPKRVAFRKDLAYTLLKVGESEEARDQFAEVMRFDPADTHVALEYAFLCYETKQQVEARRVFDRLRKTGNATAEQAFENIDKPLRDGIARWTKALESSPNNFSAHFELARLAEQRDELPLAAEHYEKAWQIRPDERSLLLDLGRVWQGLGLKDKAQAALIAASRGAQPRISEAARALLPARYPYLSEFQAALALDPKNIDLRRELAYFYLQLGKKAEASKEFEVVHQLAPDDLLTAAQLGFLRLENHDLAGARPLLDQVLKGGDEELADRVRTALKLPQEVRRSHEAPASAPESSAQAKAMAEKSYRAGYLKDALKYLKIAHESDPLDFNVMLKLAWTYNLLHDDKDAYQWFSLARKSPDPAIASEAGHAYNNLRPELERFTTTAWIYPFYSTRWKDLFAYSQIKTETKLGSLPIRAYISTRFIGDARGSTAPAFGNGQPQYLSESSFILGLGMRTDTWHGITGWGEAGEAFSYLGSHAGTGLAIPDYRGGVSLFRGIGRQIGGKPGFFADTTDDGIYVHRFDRDLLLYSQNRTGYTFVKSESLDGFQSQIYLNWNFTVDRERQYWANFIEGGPGFRFHFDGMPKSLLFSVNLLRGVYTVNEGNPRRPNYFDFRAGFWYAITR